MGRSITTWTKSSASVIGRILFCERSMNHFFCGGGLNYLVYGRKQRHFLVVYSCARFWETHQIRLLHSSPRGKLRDLYNILTCGFNHGRAGVQISLVTPTVHLLYRIMLGGNRARQTGFIVSYQPLTWFTCVRAIIFILYSFLFTFGNHGNKWACHWQLRRQISNEACAQQ